MPFLILVRHAENDYTRRGYLAGRIDGVHLNSRGREQAQALADLLAKLPIKGIYSSPLERAIETADPLARKCNLHIQTHPGLIEIDYGEWQGQSLKKLQRNRLWKVLQHTPASMYFPGGEGVMEAQFRACKTVREIALDYGEKDWVVCFSHADIIKLVIAQFLGMPIETYQRLTIGLASISMIYLHEQTIRLLSVNFDLSMFENILNK